MSEISLNRYAQIITEIFRRHFQAGMTRVPFEREALRRIADELDIPVPKNLGDILYSFKYRAIMPSIITETAPEGYTWTIKNEGQALYAFVLIRDTPFTPNPNLIAIKIPDSTPGIVALYSSSDEQALLARLRYNRLLDIFTGVTCYSLQNHLRTTVAGFGQIETDELYVGIDQTGTQYVFPIQAKGKNDRLHVTQIEQDIALCQARFEPLLCRAIGAQFITSDSDTRIALFEFSASDDGIGIINEKHYRLVSPDQLTPDDLRLYRSTVGRG